MTMNRTHRLQRRLLLVCLLTPILTVESRAIELEDRYGRRITADLVSHLGTDGEKVKIAQGGKAYDVVLSTFSERSRKEIRDWIRENPSLGPKLELELSAGKTKLRKDAYVYSVTVENRSKSAAPPLRVEYLVFGRGGSGLTSRKGEHAFAAPIPGGEKATFKTKHFDPNVRVVKSGRAKISISSRSSNQPNPRGAKTLAGVLVRVFDTHGDLVAEQKWPSAFKGEWPDPVGDE